MATASWSLLYSAGGAAVKLHTLNLAHTHQHRFGETLSPAPIWSLHSVGAYIHFQHRKKGTTAFNGSFQIGFHPFHPYLCIAPKIWQGSGRKKTNKQTNKTYHTTTPERSNKSLNSNLATTHIVHYFAKTTANQTPQPRNGNGRRHHRHASPSKWPWRASRCGRSPSEPSPQEGGPCPVEEAWGSVR